MRIKRESQKDPRTSVIAEDQSVNIYVRSMVISLAEELSTESSPLPIVDIDKVIHSQYPHVFRTFIRGAGIREQVQDQDLLDTVLEGVRRGISLQGGDVPEQGDALGFLGGALSSAP